MSFRLRPLPCGREKKTFRCWSRISSIVTQRESGKTIKQISERCLELLQSYPWPGIAAFRWGGLLKLHDISAMEFPYSVEGLTAQHSKMRWPDIKEPNAPDKPGTRFRLPFGAVPVVLCLGYPALA